MNSYKLLRREAKKLNNCPFSGLVSALQENPAEFLENISSKLGAINNGGSVDLGQRLIKLLPTKDVPKYVNAGRSHLHASDNILCYLLSTLEQRYSEPS